jgi:hypothetical protein
MRWTTALQHERIFVKINHRVVMVPCFFASARNYSVSAWCLNRRPSTQAAIPTHPTRTRA